MCKHETNKYYSCYSTGKHLAYFPPVLSFKSSKANKSYDSALNMQHIF